MALFTAFRTLVATVGLGLLLAGCAPTMTYQLRPVSGDVAQIDGRTVTKATSSDSLVIVASYEREDLQYIALDIEVKNHTGQPLEVDPARFSTLALDADQQPLPDPTTAQSSDQHKAADPDREAKQVITDRVQEEKRLKRARILNTVLMVAAVVGDISSSGRPQRYEKFVANRIAFDGAYQLIQAKRIVDRTTFVDRIQRLDYEAYRWDQLAMKRTTLQPGESVRGFVYLPKAPKAAFLQLRYPTSETDNGAILFEQTTGRKR
ncbi:MAG: hypothetical protein H7Z72_11310 [Bacteroidetes bacterium]|nr:hypothetical protein [Fibrella sp.]